LPAERLHHQVRVDAADAGGVDLAFRRGLEDAEVDALGGEVRLATRTGACGLVHEVVALLLQVARHLPRQRLHDAQPDQSRWVPLVAAPRALAVALQERVVGLGARAVRAPDPVARGTGDGLRSAEEPVLHAMERSGRSAGRPTPAEAVRKVVLVLEEELPQVGQLRETDVPRRDARRIQRGVHLAKERARRRGLTQAQRVPAPGETLRLARRLQAERRGSDERDTVGSPRGRFVAGRAPAYQPT